ncbi:hypothetical protein INR49_003458 [Caranx melampygus]|nr:hypothetical protein INR49_003458 [Caranx melampygus]
MLKVQNKPASCLSQSFCSSLGSPNSTQFGQKPDNEGRRGLFSALALFLLMGAVFTQRTRPRKPTRRPATTRKPSVPKPAVPAQPEPQEPTDFPPPILGPASVYPDCPRECLCSPSYPNSLNCENRNIRVVPVIPSRTHYLYLQNNYISEVTAEAFNNATEVRWINLANNRIHRIDKQVKVSFISADDCIT